MLGSGRGVGVSINLHKGAMRRYHSWLSPGQRVTDALLVFFILTLLCYLYLGVFPKSFQVIAVLGAMLTWISMGL